MRIYLFINTEPAMEHKVIDSIERVMKVIEVHLLFGEYDILAVLEAAESEVLYNQVIPATQSIKGVQGIKVLQCKA